MRSLHKIAFRVLILGLTVGTMAACINEENKNLPREDEFYLKFKAGGIDKKYTALPNSLVSFFHLEDAKIYGGNITGIKNIQEPTRDFVTIQLVNETAYQPNHAYQLQDPVVVDLISRARIIFTYADENGKVYNATLLKERHPSLPIIDEATVRFTEMTPTYVRGTFSARLGETDFITLANREELLITEGEFYLPRNDAPNYR